MVFRDQTFVRLCGGRRWARKSTFLSGRLGWEAARPEVVPLVIQSKSLSQSLSDAVLQVHPYPEITRPLRLAFHVGHDEVKQNNACDHEHVIGDRLAGPLLGLPHQEPLVANAQKGR